jgi:TrwC relaxase
VWFAERPGADPGKRPIREIVGVDPRLNQRWSTRRAHINTRRGELAIQFQNDHGRPPTPVEALQLAATGDGARRAITRVAEHGGLTVRHIRSRLTVRLPID